MVNERKIRNLIRVADVYFEIPADFKRNKYTIVNYYDMYEKVEDSCKVISEQKDGNTIINYIDKSDDEIFSDFHSNVRNEIRRAKKDGASTEFVDLSNECNARNIFKEIDTVRHDMYMAKGIKAVSVETNLSRLYQNGMLRISKGIYNQKTVVWHVLYCGDGKVRLLYSITAFRQIEDNTERNALGRVNRMVHYDEMLHFRDEGAKIYDWGGFGTNSDVESISNFKEKFGGKVIWHTSKSTVKRTLFGLISYLYLKR